MIAATVDDLLLENSSNSHLQQKIITCFQTKPTMYQAFCSVEPLLEKHQFGIAQGKQIPISKNSIMKNTKH